MNNVHDFPRRFPVLRPTSWAMEQLGYDQKQRVAFWQFVKRNRVPVVRTGLRKVQFDEAAVLAWIKRRSTPEPKE